MFRIAKEFHFSASHIIDGLPEGHKCGRLHGHNYKVVLYLTAVDLDDVGFVVDFGDLKPFKNLIDDELDHYHLNDILEGQTTAENIAKWLADRAAGMFGEFVEKVRVWETAKAWGEYEY
jgi:6-pyruvoyltetrahydropterin/6-carboxytetrahydropterin synthase